MNTISLTDFVDIASKVGLHKFTNIRKIMNRPEYQPAFDYYKILRDHIIYLHKNNLYKNNIKEPRELTSDKKKWQNYSKIIEGYKKFWGRKQTKWFEPPRGQWNENSITVILNPELGLKINNEKFYAIKMYFKADPLSKNRIDISLFLMHQFLPKMINGDEIIYSILDIRKSKLYTPTSFPEDILNALIAETAYISSIWT